MERGAIDRVGRRPRPTFVRERARAMDARRGRRARGKYLCVLRARPLRPSSVAFASSSVASSSRIIFHSLLFIQSSENRNGCENGRARAFVPRRRRASRHGRPPTFLVHLLRAHRRRRRRRRRRARTARDATDARATRGAAPRRAGARTDRRVTAAPLASVARVIGVIGVVVAYVIVSLERRVRVCGARFDRSIRSRGARAPVAFHVYAHTYIDLQE